MKMITKKRMLSMVLAVMTLTGTSFAGTGFQDLSNVKEAPSIIKLQERGFIKGTSNSTFLPNRVLTSVEGIHMINAAFDLNLDLIRFIKEPFATDYFKNADDKAWYANGLIVASVNGVDLPADLDPKANWTKEEFLYRLVSTLEVKHELPMIKLVPVDIKDDSNITIEYSGLIQRAIHYGIVELDAGGNLNPKQELTRAEAAAILLKTIEYAESLNK